MLLAKEWSLKKNNLDMWYTLLTWWWILSELAQYEENYRVENTHTQVKISKNSPQLTLEIMAKLAIHIKDPLRGIITTRYIIIRIDKT